MNPQSGFAMAPTDSKERFSSRVADYVRYRPGYPRAILDTLREECGFKSKSVIVDVGSGTGLLATIFLENGNTVYGVEPNAEMRAAGEQFLSSYPKFHSVAASAEATTLPDASVDFVTAGQAFHWFDPEGAHREFARILKRGGWALVIWNERRVEGSALLRAYEDMLRRHSPDYAQVSAKYPEALRMAEFFGPNQVRHREFPNKQIFDFEGFRGRLLSSSYSPPPGHPNHEPILAELRRIFDAHNENGRVRVDYTTHVYYGQLQI
jgi:ubiquinone/menaquinone biosynthesis C-methylase UbiE